LKLTEANKTVKEQRVYVHRQTKAKTLSPQN